MSEGNKDIILEQQEHLLESSNTKSDVSFTYDRNRFMIFPRKKGFYTDEQLLNYARNRPGMAEYLANAQPDKVQAIIDDSREAMKIEGRGGYDLTHRTLNEMDEIVPGILSLCSNVKGKVVILGNGLSLAPEEILKINKHKDSLSITVVDFINYRDLFEDLSLLKSRFLDAKLPFPKEYDESLAKVKRLLSMIQAKQINYERHFIGEGNMPDSIKNADLVVNVFGPDVPTQNEQVALLKPGGILITNYDFRQVNHRGFNISRITNKGRELGTLIKRNKFLSFF